jgi:poly [ADP-ribose] polymerase
VTTKVKAKDFRSDRHPEVVKIVNRLQSFAKGSVEQNYTVSSDKVTQKQVNAAQVEIEDLVKISYSKKDIAKINEKLVSFYSIIPRKMKNVKLFLLSSELSDVDNKKRFETILKNEQDTLDVMAGQVILDSKMREASAEENSTDTIDILEAVGLDMIPVNDAKVIEKIKKLMQSKSRMFVHAFEVKNNRTSLLYDKHLQNSKNQQTELFWHGSRTENWWSIMEKGLLIRPSGAVYTGSMFGDGIYFASEFDKSLGYTSINSSRWAGGNQNNAFLAIYEVHVGKQYVTMHSDYSLSWKTLQQKGGYDSTWGKKGSSLIRDEYIVYQPQQCTIRYLVEVQGSQY